MKGLYTDAEMKSDNVKVGSPVSSFTPHPCLQEQSMFYRQHIVVCIMPVLINGWDARLIDFELCIPCLVSFSHLWQLRAMLNLSIEKQYKLQVIYLKIELVF